MARRKGSSKAKEQIKKVEIPKESQTNVEYVVEQLDLSQDNDYLAIFSRFQLHQPEETTPEPQPEQAVVVDSAKIEDESFGLTLSKKRFKKQTRMTLAQLKNLAPKPEVVEFEDTTAPDPLFLVHLKALPNTVPVPSHWSQKRKYLAGKRGYLKPPYELPEYIKATGIMEQRNTLRQREESMSLSAKAREKINPRMGKITLDYECLYNAFFKYQTKPELTGYGDVYYEGKEFEARLRDKKPGIISEELSNALGMTPLAPPPWLYNMQRFGPPPSYPFLKIPGLSAPIPEGCQWGFHPGGWGKPPVDEHNRPLYGDVFGLGIYNVTSFSEQVDEADMEHWGVVLPEDEIVIAPPPPDEPEVVAEPSAILEEQPTVVFKHNVQSKNQQMTEEVHKPQRTLYTVLPESVSKPDDSTVDKARQSPSIILPDTKMQATKEALARPGVKKKEFKF